MEEIGALCYTHSTEIPASHEAFQLSVRGGWLPQEDRGVDHQNRNVYTLDKKPPGIRAGGFLYARDRN